MRMADKNYSFALVALNIPISPKTISFRATALTIFGLISIALKSLEVCNYLSFIPIGTILFLGIKSAKSLAEFVKPL